jgi:hypothetical protein
VLRATGAVGLTNEEALSQGIVSSTDASLGAREYIDLSASFDLGKGLSMRVGANNLLDKSPPIFGSTNSSTSAFSASALARLWTIAALRRMGSILASLKQLCFEPIVPEASTQARIVLLKHIRPPA